MGSGPGVVEVGALAVVRLVERPDHLAAGPDVPGRRFGFHAERRIVRREMAEVVVEGAVLLHQHHEVIDLAERYGGRNGARSGHDRQCGHGGERGRDDSLAHGRSFWIGWLDRLVLIGEATLGFRHQGHRLLPPVLRPPGLVRFVMPGSSPGYGLVTYFTVGSAVG